jgi:hypothetical protein
VNSPDLTGVTANECPRACSAARCVISTVGVCKHPCKSSTNGCGPISLANREKALVQIKLQKVTK